MIMTRAQKIIFLVIVSSISLTGYILFSQIVYGLGFPLDDAWIHQTYARNLVQLGEWSYIPGSPSAGSTAPLWTFILAGGYVLKMPPYVWVGILGLTSLICLGWIAYAYFERTIQVDRWFIILAVFVLLFEYHLVWASLSGMETLLYGVVITFVLLGPMVWSIPPFWLGLVIGISIWMRPDGLTLVFPCLFVLLFDYHISREFFLQAGRLLLGAAVFFLPYLLFNYLLAGSLWPSTLFAKQAEYAILRELPIISRLLRIYALPVIGVGILLLPGFLWFVVGSIRQRNWQNLAGILWVLGFILLYTLRLPVTYQHGRYIMPAMPVFFIFGLDGTHQILGVFNNLKYQHLVRNVWMISLGLVTAAFWLLGAQAYAQDVAIIETEMVAMSQWIANHTQPDDLIAAHDIGALGYFGNRDIFDLAGLITPDVIPHIRDETALISMINQSGATYLMTFPDWYALLPKCGTKIHMTHGEFVASFEKENMVLYQWRQNCTPHE